VWVAREPVRLRRRRAARHRGRPRRRHGDDRGRVRLHSAERGPLFVGRRRGDSPAQRSRRGARVARGGGVTSSTLLVALLAGIAGLGIGLAIGYARSVRVRELLAAREAELGSRSALEVERERVVALAAERLTGVFGQFATEQFRNHSETF